MSPKTPSDWLDTTKVTGTDILRTDAEKAADAAPASLVDLRSLRRMGDLQVVGWRPLHELLDDEDFLRQLTLLGIDVTSESWALDFTTKLGAAKGAALKALGPEGNPDAGATAISTILEASRMSSSIESIVSGLDQRLNEILEIPDFDSNGKLQASYGRLEAFRLSLIRIVMDLREADREVLHAIHEYVLQVSHEDGGQTSEGIPEEFRQLYRLVHRLEGLPGEVSPSVNGEFLRWLLEASGDEDSYERKQNRRPHMEGYAKEPSRNVSPDTPLTNVYISEAGSQYRTDNLTNNGELQRDIAGFNSALALQRSDLALVGELESTTDASLTAPLGELLRFRDNYKDDMHLYGPFTEHYSHQRQLHTSVVHAATALGREIRARHIDPPARALIRRLKTTAEQNAQHVTIQAPSRPPWRMVVDHLIGVARRRLESQVGARRLENK